jgi:hypothetical protein
MPSLLQSLPRCSFRFPRNRLLRRPGTPSLRPASAATVPARPHCMHFARRGNLAFKPGEDVDDFALRFNTMLQKMVQFGDDTYDERAIEKLFCCILNKYKQIARSIESLLDLSTMTIEEMMGHLKVVDDDEPQALSGPITIGRKLHVTREHWEACQGDKKKRMSSSSIGGRKRGKPHRGARSGTRGRADGGAHEGAQGGPPATRNRHETTPATTVASSAIGLGIVDSHDAARPTSHRRRRLYS